MREASFVARNKEKWIVIENNLKNNLIRTPDELANDYIQLTNDLAYAQTFYPQSNTLTYLNDLTMHVHHKIYKDERNSSEQLINFFLKVVPAAVYRNRTPLLIALGITLFFTLIGWISAAKDPEFVRLILGDYYVDMTIENIKNNDPGAVYRSSEEIGMTIGITINNIMVAFRAFVFGILGSVVTGYILFQNAIMLGAFHEMFYEHGVLGTAMSAIWIHGVFEISVIIIAGGCGIMLGNSWLFPGSYRRIDSLKRKGKDAVTILASTIPFFIVAGTLEGFVTRHYNFSLGISLSIIFICLIIICFYYIYLPIKHSRDTYERI